MSAKSKKSIKHRAPRFLFHVKHSGRGQKPKTAPKKPKAGLQKPKANFEGKNRTSKAKAGLQRQKPGFKGAKKPDFKGKETGASRAEDIVGKMKMHSGSRMRVDSADNPKPKDALGRKICSEGEPA